MSKVFVVLFILVVIFIGFFYFLKRDLTNPAWQDSKKEDISEKVLDFSKVSRVSYNNHEYSYLYFTVTNPKNLILIPNFTDQKSTQKITEENQCLAGINGGFYNEENNPLGGFISEGKTYKAPVESTLLDGYLQITENQAEILATPLVDSRISLQSGPILFDNGNLKNLSINNDEYKRRSVALITEKKELLFVTVFDYRDVIIGPSLEELPSVINEIANREKFSLNSAINLDGGNASAIHVENFVLLENTHVGSFFCLRK